MLRRWLFLLPALYLGVLCLAAIDAGLGLSGGGETNFGAWVVIFSFMPAAAVAKATGSSVYLFESPILMLMSVLLQTLLLAALGATIDAILRHRKSGQ